MVLINWNTTVTSWSGGEDGASRSAAEAGGQLAGVLDHNTTLRDAEALATLTVQCFIGHDWTTDNRRINS